MLTKERANKYIRENKRKVVEKYRLGYHFMPELGWMNDPNGVVEYQGKYHLFYQYNPYDSKWGPMYWGHATSTNFYDWTYEEVALAPDLILESGCFSGGSIVKQDKLYLMYTSHLEASDNNGVQVQVQNIAISHDGIEFKKYKNNPVISQKDIPLNTSKNDFRDPNPIKIGDNYYTVIGSKTEDEVGQFLIYKSKDLLEWTYLNKIGPNKLFGVMGECPDLFYLNGKFVLLFSAISLKSDNHLYRNVNSCLYIVGDFNTETGEFLIDNIDEIDGGHDFYAPQTLIDSQGRRIMIAWMEMWGKTYITHEEKHYWAGAMTIPRELTLNGAQLIQKPVSDLLLLRKNQQTLNNIKLKDTKYNFGIVSAQSELVLYGTTKNTVVLTFKHDENDYFKIEVSSQAVTLRTESSQLYPQEPRVRYNKLESEIFDLNVFIDTSSIEIFAFDGTATITTRIYFDTEFYELALESGEATIVEMNYYELNR